MTELKARPGESAAEYAERTREALDGRRQTAETATTQERKGMNEAAQESTRRGRIAHQERAVERAVEEFEAAKKRLYRVDGTKVFGEEEHAERLDGLTGELREKTDAVVAEAQGNAEAYEREALALSYTDPAETVAASERGRLETSRAFVKEDCEDMAVPALTERISAVSAGSDKVGQVLHARYGRRRVEALDAESSRLAREGTPAGAEVAREHRRLREAVSGLEEQLEDPKKAEREKAIKEAAAESRRVMLQARRRVSAADGTDEAARRATREQTRSVF